MKVAIILSGCGVYDGSEIHEATFVLLALNQLGADVQCFAPDKPQHEVINHLSGDQVSESRNVLQESARIARGDVKPLTDLHVESFDGLALPGGFGAAKNLTTWAFDGPQCAIDSQVASVIQAFQQTNKPILAMCIAPVVIAKALAGIPVTMTLGHAEQDSDYDIASFQQGIASLGMLVQNCAITDIVVDHTHNVITTPSYMMKGSISDVFTGINKGCKALVGG